MKDNIWYVTELIVGALMIEMHIDGVNGNEIMPRMWCICRSIERYNYEK